jgi:hypothetical protein
MTDFTATIKEWETFYLLGGTAAATLIGLLFVAVSIHIDIFHRKTSTDLHHFAALTFNCFFYALLISMLFLIPNLSPLGLGVPLFLLGLLGLLNAVLQQRRARNNLQSTQAREIASRFNLPILGLLGLFIVSVGIMFRLILSLYGIIVVIFILLISAAQNAWALLVQIEDQDLTKKTKPK